MNSSRAITLALVSTAFAAAASYWVSHSLLFATAVSATLGSISAAVLFAGRRASFARFWTRQRLAWLTIGLALYLGVSAAWGWAEYGWKVGPIASLASASINAGLALHYRRRGDPPREKEGAVSR